MMAKPQALKWTQVHSSFSSSGRRKRKEEKRRGRRRETKVWKGRRGAKKDKNQRLEEEDGKVGKSVSGLMLSDVLSLGVSRSYGIC